jgi:uncharacterized repeat protein (TIGR01451 family)
MAHRRLRIAILALFLAQFAPYLDHVQPAEAATGLYKQGVVHACPFPGTTLSSADQTRHLINQGLVGHQFFPESNTVNIYNATACNIPDGAAGVFYQQFQIFFPLGHPLRYAGQRLIHQEGGFGIPAGHVRQFVGIPQFCTIQNDSATHHPGGHFAGNEQGHPNAQPPLMSRPLCVNSSTACTITMPDVLTPGQTVEARFTTINNGTTTWFGNMYTLMSNAMGGQGIDNAVWNLSRAPVAGLVAPGQTVTIVANVRAPQTAGVHQMVFQMGQEGFERFGCTFVKNVTVQNPAVSSSRSSASSSVISSSRSSSVASSQISSSRSSSASSVSSSIASSAISSSASSVSSSIASSASSVSSSVQSSVSNLGCVDVKNITLNPSGGVLFPTAQFQYALDVSGQPAFNDANGNARFNNVPVGTRVVTQQLPTGWQSLSVVPAGGAVTVSAGSACAQVTFTNQQSQQTPTFTVQKTDGKTTATKGEILSYTITVTNTSNAAANGVIVTDELPNELDYVSASETVSVNGRSVTWNVGSIPGGQSRTLILRAQIKPNVSNGTVIRNEAKVTINGSTVTTGGDETTVGGNEDTDIEITINDDPDPVEAGGYLTYEIEVCNEGDDDLEDLTVLQILPDDVEVTEDDGGEEDDGTITWDNVDIDEDDCVTFEVEVEVDDDLDEGDELETVVLVDGSSEEEITEIGEEDDDGEDDGLTIQKDASSFEVFPGGVVEYTLTIENDTGDDLEDIVIEDQLRGSSFTIVDDGGADDRSGNTLTWELDELEDGESEVIRYRISIDQNAFPGSTIVNDVTVEADGEEDSDSATVSVINNLPQTGFGIGGDGTSEFLRPYGGNKNGGTAAWIAILSVMMTGAGAGMTLGRRYFSF